MTQCLFHHFPIFYPKKQRRATLKKFHAQKAGDILREAATRTT